MDGFGGYVGGHAKVRHEEGGARYAHLVPDDVFHDQRAAEPWRKEVSAWFALTGPEVDISPASAPNLARLLFELAIDGRSGLSLVEGLDLAIRLADERQSQSPNREQRALRSGARAALGMEGELLDAKGLQVETVAVQHDTTGRPLEQTLVRLTNSNGQVVTWPSLSGRQAWSFFCYRFVMDRARPASASAASGRRYWARYEASLIAAIEALIADPRSLLPEVRQQSLADVWNDCEINQRIQTVDRQKDSYVLRTEFQLSRPGGDVVVAQTYHETSADWICAEFPEILDIFTTTTGGSMTFSADVRPLAQSDIWSTLEFDEDDELRAVIIERFPETRDYGIRIWRSRHIPIVGEYRLALQCDFELPLGDPYFYWTAPRRVWLRRVHADISALMPGIAGRIWSAPKLGRRPTIRINQDMGILDIEVGGWVEAGQSIDVRWDKA